jgi:hypothetical protein
VCLFMDRSRVGTEGVSDIEAAMNGAISAIAGAQPDVVREAPSTAGDDATVAELFELEDEEERDLFRRRAATLQPTLEVSSKGEHT